MPQITKSVRTERTMSFEMDVYMFMNDSENIFVTNAKTTGKTVQISLNVDNLFSYALWSEDVINDADFNAERDHKGVFLHVDIIMSSMRPDFCLFKII